MILASFTVTRDPTVPQGWTLEYGLPLPIHLVSARYDSLTQELVRLCQIRS